MQNWNSQHATTGQFHKRGTASPTMLKHYHLKLAASLRTESSHLFQTRPWTTPQLRRQNLRPLLLRRQCYLHNCSAIALKSPVGALCRDYGTIANKTMTKDVFAEQHPKRRMYNLPTLSFDEKLSTLQTCKNRCQYQVPSLTYSTRSLSPHSA